MARHFTCYWDDDTLAAHAETISSGGRPTASHTSGSGFIGRGVGPGDSLYVLNWFEGELRVLGRLAVDSIVDDATAKLRLGDVEPAAEHVLEIGGSGTPIVLDAVFDDDELEALTFLDVSGEHQPIARNGAGGIDTASFEGVREVDDDTADFFDRLLGFDLGQHFGDGPTRRWIAILVELTDGGDDDGADDEFGAQEETVVELELELQGDSADVPERWAQIEHTVDDTAVLSDPAGVAALVEQLLLAWGAVESVELDADQLRSSLSELAAQDEIPLEHDHDGHEHA